MSDPSGGGADGEPRPLRTTPRPAAVHWLVDSAVVFLALIILGLILGAPWWAIVILSLVLGSFAARFTWRADVAAMDARQAGRTDGQAGTGSR